ncbi:MAG: hypothetical protein V3T86_06685 [Planctomycetota bacterium]
MNYFAHGVGSFGDPYRLAGTAVPDWIRASDRRSRLRPERLDGEAGLVASLAAGIRRHFEDDRWFHQTAAFHEVSRDLTRRVVALEPDNRHMRAFFLGHVLLELLLDACLIEREPESLPRYYEALAQADAGEIGRAVAGWSEPAAERLGRFMELFLQERFLFDYLDNQKLVHRFSQVARRAGLERVPDGLVGLLPEARELVRAATDALMTGGEGAG